MEQFKKYWGILALVIGGAAGVFGWFYNQGAASQDLNGRVFDSPEQKVTVVKKVEELPTPEEEWKKYYLDSIDTSNRMKSRKTRDSLMLLEHKARRYTDSINLLNADQLYQTKREIKSIKEAINSLRHN